MSQESGVRSRESGVGGQESGVGGQGRGDRPVAPRHRIDSAVAPTAGSFPRQLTDHLQILDPVAHGPSSPHALPRDHAFFSPTSET